MPTKYQLKNGLSVLLVENKKSPVVSIQVWVKTGSADEKKGLEGISHFIEHLVFKGTDKYGVGEIAKTIEGSGGILNAYTTFDQTVFYVTLSKEYLETGLDVLSQMMGAPTFDENEVNSEREVVIEEIKRSLDNPRSQASRLLFENFYKKHPYGIPVIGYEENIRKVSIKEIRKYFDSRYVPQNMKLLVIGDISQADAKKKILNSFGALKKKSLHKVIRKTEPKIKSARVRVKETDYHESQLFVSWPLPKSGSKDHLALSVMSVILGEGETSRLYQSLRNEKKIVNTIGSSLFSPRDTGFFAITALLKKENLEAAYHEITKQVAQLIEQGVTQDEVAKAVRMIESEKFYSMETVDGLAGLYGHYEFFYGDYRKFEDAVKKLGKMKPADVLSVAKKYLSPKTMVISTLVGGKNTRVQATSEQFVQEFKSAIQKSQKHSQKIKIVGKQKKVGIQWHPKANSHQLDVEKISLKSGPRVLFKEMSGSSVVSARVAFLGGLRHEPANKEGLNELSARVWSAGTKQKSEHELNLKIEEMASSLSSFGGRNSIGVSMGSLVPFAIDTAKLWAEVISSPRIDAGVMEREKTQMIEAIKSRKDKPSVRCMHLLNKTIFGEHPYGRDPLGTEESLKNISHKDIADYIGKLCSARNMVVSIAGDTPKQKWIDELNSLSQQLSQKEIEKLNLEMPNISKSKVVYEESQNEQSHLALAYRGLTLVDPDRLALDLMQTILSGQGGRLFIELRDKASLAYSVSPIRMDGIEQGYFGTYIGCSPEKAQTAYNMMKAELMRLGEELVSNSELEKNKMNMIGRHDISLQRTSTVADGYLFDELYGLDFRESDFFKNKIQKISSEDVQRVARRILSGNFILSVVGKKTVSI